MKHRKTLASLGLALAAFLSGSVGAPAQTVGPVPTGIDYDVPNFANSPLPKLTGSLSGIRLVDSGCGFTVAPTVTIDPPAKGTRAQAVASLNSDGSISVLLTDPGSGYVTTPAVTFTLPAGMKCKCPAAAVAVMGVEAGTGLRKFVDSLPGLGKAGINNLGQYIPVAVSDTTAYPGDDYYEIALVDYRERMHTDLAGATRLRGYVQIYPPGSPEGAAKGVPLLDLQGKQITVDLGHGAVPVYGYDKPHYMGPLINATKDRATRIKFYNLLPAGAEGNLFLPVDTTIMGSGEAGWAQGLDGVPHYFDSKGAANDYADLNAKDASGNPLVTPGIYPQNRANLHLHGGLSPWIGDGTPHQWTVPVGDISTPYQKGVSSRDVPDMTGGQGVMTFYYPNQQSGRLMFYHDHSWGITRLNVYAGEAAGYLLSDPNEESALAAAGLPALQIPLVIQDKTYVWGTKSNATTQASATGTWLTDPLWADVVPGSAPGDLWLPHVYMPNQNPGDAWTGANALGRFDYGPWFWPPQTPADLQPLPAVSTTPEAFMDTMVVNGTAYPYVNVPAQKVRLRILNACNDRMINLQFYQADPNGFAVGGDSLAAITTTAGGSGYTAPTASITGGGGTGATATVSGSVDATITLVSGGAGYIQPAITFKGDGTGAAATATVVDGVIQSITLTSAGTGYTSAPAVVIQETDANATVTAAASATATIGQLVVTLGNPGAGYASAPSVLINDATGVGATAASTLTPRYGTEVAMVPATANPAIPFPDLWKTQVPGMIPEILDNRPGGIPDPRFRGPSIVQIGTEAGLLPAPVVLPNTPVGYEQNKRNIVVLNISQKTLLMGPAERADVVVDFSAYAGKTVILYSDSPAPVPAGDPRLSYYTGNEDYSATGGDNYQGGAPATLPGFGPNVRTVMQFRVAPAAAGTPVVEPIGDEVDPALVNNLGATLSSLFKGRSASEPIVVPEPTYPVDSGAYSDFAAFARIQDTSLTFTAPDGSGTMTLPMLPKAIHELFDNRGRMNSVLGVEIPFTSWLIQTTIPYQYIDPSTETITPGETQVWKITHNGVDTHAIHFHLVNVQVINRVGWDGAVRPPDANELGWKETVRMNPLEDCIVAVRAKPPILPWKLESSLRPLDPSAPLGTTVQFTGVDPKNNPVTVTNLVTDFGWEYVWHCHLLGHEENDMMRPFSMMVDPNDKSYVADRTLPLVTAILNPIKNALGFSHTDVQVSITATDAGSGIASITYSAAADPVAGGQTIATTVVPATGAPSTFTVTPVINQDGVTWVTYFATDAQGNKSAPATINVSRYSVGPAVTWSAAPAGWSKVPVTLDWTAVAQGPFGIESSVPAFASASGNSASGQVTVSAQGTTQASVTVVDQAGNSVTAQSAPVKIDGQAPTISSWTPVVATPNGGTLVGATTWYRSVSVGYTATDGANGSGIDTASSTPSPVVLPTGLAQHAQVTLADVAGNIASYTDNQAYNVDGIAPGFVRGTAVGANANGWNNANITGLTLTASDNLSGVRSIAYTVAVNGRNGSTSGTANTALSGGAYPSPYTTGSIAIPGPNLTTDGTYVVNVGPFTITDGAGNTASGTALAPFTFTVKLDKTAPSISNAQTVTKNSRSSFTFNALPITEAGSGLTGQSVSVLSVKYGQNANLATAVAGLTSTPVAVVQGANNVWSLSAPLTASFTAPAQAQAQNRSLYVVLQVTDLAGNTGTVTYTIANW